VIVLGLLAISTGVTFWMNPEVADQFLVKGSSLLNSFTKQSKEAEKTSEGKNDESQTPNPVLADGNKEVPPGPPKELEHKVELDANAPVAPVRPTTATTPTVTAATESSSQAATGRVITELPEAAIQGRLWLKDLPAEAYVLEHQNFATLKEARAFMKDKEWLVNARITPVFKEDKDEASFAVMTGPYRTIDRAKNTIARLKLPTNVTITSVQMANKQALGARPAKSNP